MSLGSRASEINSPGRETPVCMSSVVLFFNVFELVVTQEAPQDTLGGRRLLGIVVQHRLKRLQSKSPLAELKLLSWLSFLTGIDLLPFIEYILIA